jgi:hypothetical protein
VSGWRIETPDGRALIVWRSGKVWHARCRESEAESSIIDVALMEAIRADSDVVAHEHVPDLPLWVRTQAALIEERIGESPPPRD